MTEGSKKVLKFLQNHPGQEFTKREIAEGLDTAMNVVTGSVNAMVKKGLAEERVDVYPSLLRQNVVEEVRWVKITEKGLTFDPDEEERREAREKARLAAVRKAERKREKEERARKNAVL